MKALYLCGKIAQSLQYNIRPLFALGLLCFIVQINGLVSLDSDLRDERVKPACLLLIRETRRQ